MTELLICKICGYKAKQLHQHIKAVHNMRSIEYRNIYGIDSVMQIGFNPIPIIPKKRASDVIKHSYCRIKQQLDSIDCVYNIDKIINILSVETTFNKYCGKAKYRTMIKDDIVLYKSILFHSKILDDKNIKVRFELRMKFIIDFNCNLEKTKCQCGRRYTFGKPCRRCDEIKRINAYKEFELKFGNSCPNYNKKSIPIIESAASEMGISDLLHAENGGEFVVSGYHLDGYSPSRNIAFEYDEARHFNPDGSLKINDIIRQRNIENILGCTFIRIKDNE